MAMRVEIRSVGVDVSKDRVEISEGGAVTCMANTGKGLEEYFGQLPGPARVAVESTSRYHVGVVKAALGCGHTVYLVDGFRLSRYRDAIGLRAKTDVTDAHLLSRYVAAEGERLVPYRIPPKAVQELRELLRARAQLKKNQVAVRLSLEGVEDGDLASSHAALDRQFRESIALIDRKLKHCLKESGYASEAARCLAIPGVGALNAAGLVAAYHRGVFRSGDAFVAFLGLDVRVRESGRYSGRRKLSKRGDPELRRLLFNAARAGARTSTWRGPYEHLRARGLSTTAACVVLARKIARVAFALLRDQSQFRHSVHADAA